MTSLDYNHKRFVVKMLALGHSPGEVAEMIGDKFLVQPGEEEIRQLLPEGSSTMLSEDLQRLYRNIQKRHGVHDTSQETAPEYTRVARISDLEGENHLCVEVDGKKIGLFKWGNSIFALDNRCTHQDGPLSDGTVDDGTIECPLHGARFDLETGEAVQVPATEDVRSYPVRLGKEHIELKL
jgi:3-phenylpropionate/trans-cinnamate dioxygenase ferredoxin subunit